MAIDQIVEQPAVDGSLHYRVLPRLGQLRRVDRARQFR